MAEFKRASNEFKSQLETEMRQLEVEELKKRAPEPSPSILPPPGSIASGAGGGAAPSEPESGIPSKAADA